MFRASLATSFRGKCFINNYDVSVVFQVYTKVSRFEVIIPYRFVSGGVKEATMGKRKTMLVTPSVKGCLLNKQPLQVIYTNVYVYLAK